MNPSDSPIDKVCTKCKTEKPLKEFSPGLSWCKQCYRTDYKRRRTLRKAAKEAGKPILYFDEKRAKIEERDTVLFPEDWTAFYQAAKSKEERFLLLFDLMQSIGCRINEALPLRFVDFNFDNGTLQLHILKRIYPTGAFTEYVRPDLLDKIKTVTRSSDMERIFPFTYMRSWRTFKRIAARAGLRSKLSPHALRHVHASRLNGIPMTDSEKLRLSRHVAKNVLQGYVTIFPKRHRELMERMWTEEVWIWSGASLT